MYVYVPHKIGQKGGVDMGKRSPANPPIGLEALWDVVGDDVVAFFAILNFSTSPFFSENIQVSNPSLLQISVNKNGVFLMYYMYIYIFYIIYTAMDSAMDFPE